MTELLEEDARLFPTAEIPRATLDEEPERIGERERLTFGVTWEQQWRWRPNDSFRHWRSVLQQLGILVIVKRMPWEKCRGVSLYDQGLVPTIVINSEDADNARSFTLFHEYGHLLLREPGKCIPSPASDALQVEKWANRFAAAFLILASDLRAYIARRPPGGDLNDLTLQEIRRMATDFRVSRYVMARRLEELSFSNFYQRSKAALYAFDKRPAPSRKGGGAPSPEVSKVAELGSGTSMVIVNAVRNQLIDRTEAADALDLKVSQLAGFEARAESQRYKDRAGV
ncbi:MAG TPA: ImmA/IrrE family metallo-endopeptidase [Dehalococcoidia bacterium]|nr:ImmA/IrrE family metallo-endopeptidase [Dehalococcoidia bacterium]